MAEISVTDECCEECASFLLEVHFNKNDTPLEGGETLHRGCMKCDDIINSRITGGFATIYMNLG
jgi:hypothetical protein